MTLQKSYPTHPSSSISLDTIANAATFFSGKWTPALKRNQSQQLLGLLITRMYWSIRDNLFGTGNPFHATIRASHASLAASLELSREWVCTLSGRLKQEKWIEASTARRPGSKHQEVTTYRPGKRLKRLLIQLRESRKSCVNDRSQKIPSSSPSSEQVNKNLLFLGSLRETLSKKLGVKT